jgi:hypothetical protein
MQAKVRISKTDGAIVFVPIASHSRLYICFSYGSLL